MHDAVRPLHSGAGLPVPGPHHARRSATFPHRRWLADTGVDLPAALRQRNIDVRLCDAETDADLDAIVADGRALQGRVLWCGTGGLAGALAGRLPVAKPKLPRPILALIGSDHRASATQLAAVPDLHRRLPMHHPTQIARHLAHGAAVVTVDLPAVTPRDTACRAITAQFAELLRAIERPGTLFVTGGETLRHLCDALDVTHLDVDGEIEPGVPTSILRGGAWDGQRLVSKSGAFGDAGFLQRLLRHRRRAIVAATRQRRLQCDWA